MRVKGFKGMQYVKLKGIEKALGNDIDIMDSLTAIKRNHDTVEDLGVYPVCTTKVFMNDSYLLELFNNSIVFTYGTTMCFPIETGEFPEIRISLDTTGDCEKITATISIELDDEIDTDSTEYREHIETHRSEYENLVGEKIYYSDGNLAYDFQTIEDVIRYDTMRYDEMILDSDGNVKVEMDIDLTAEEVEAIKEYFATYYKNQGESNIA